MKKLCFLFVFLGVICGVKSQNTFPPDGGNVGIGTDTPSQELQIVTENEGINYLMHLGGNTHLSGNAFGIGFNPEGWHDGYANRIKTAIVVEGNGTGWSRGNLHVLQNNINDMTAASLSDAVFTVSAAGKIGIGTTAPEAKLQIGDYGGNDKKIKIPGTYNFEQANLSVSGNGNAQLEFVTHSGISNSGGTRLYGADEAHLYFQTAEVSNSYEDLNYETRMTLTNSGNVGIGTTETGVYKLAVEGSTGIIAEKFTVKLRSQWGFPDYVFEETYQLATLEEVEKYIDKEGHLENIPSAEDVAKEGLDLGGMNVKLLEKIEELTLYTIQQDKEIKALKKQQKEIEELKVLVRKLLKDK